MRVKRDSMVEDTVWARLDIMIWIYLRLQSPDLESKSEDSAVNLCEIVCSSILISFIYICNQLEIYKFIFC